jgi:hypothetical protein
LASRCHFEVTAIDVFIDAHIVGVHWRCTRKIILDLVFGGYPFLLCCSGAYGLASRCHFEVTAIDVFIDAHIVEGALEMHRKKELLALYLWDFCFYCVTMVHMDWHQDAIFT